MSSYNEKKKKKKKKLWIIVALIENHISQKDDPGEIQSRDRAENTSLACDGKVSSKGRGWPRSQMGISLLDGKGQTPAELCWHVKLTSMQ